MSLPARIRPVTSGVPLPKLHQPDKPLSHQEILELAEATRPDFNRDLQNPVIGCRPQNPPPPWDTCELGYRYVPYFNMESRTWEDAKIGLTPEDLLHPREEDRPMQEGTHAKDVSDVYASLRSVLRNTPNTYVSSDVGVNWQVPGFEHLHSPDVGVFFNFPNVYPVTTIPIQDWGVDVRLVFELVSRSRPAVRNNDIIHKVDEYYRVGVPQYVIADLIERPGCNRRIRLIAYRRGQNGFVSQSRNRQGRVRLNLGDNFNIWLGTYWDGPHHALGLFDGNTGELIPVAAQALEQIAAERARAQAAEAEVLAERTRAETAEADALAARILAEAAEADALSERTRSQAMAAQLQAMQALLRQHNVNLPN